MKKTKLLAIFFALVMVLALTACGGNKNPAEGSKPTYATESLANWQDYTITYMEGASDVVSDAFIQFNLKLNEKYGFTLRANSDFLMPGETVPEGTLEILVGLTNRPESIEIYESLKANDYFIGMMNNRLVIVGGSDKATAAALDYFAAYLMGSDGLDYPTAGYTYNADYHVDKLTIGGVDISEFVLVRGSGMSNSDRKLINILCEKIADICGVSLETVQSGDAEKTYEILIGNTGRELTEKSIPYGTYAIEQTDTKIAIYGNGEKSDAFVLKHLIVDVLSAIPESESYDIKLENVTGKAYSAPVFTASNLSSSFGDMRDKYDYDIVSTDTTLDRFFATVDELPEEVTVLDPVEIEDYPFSQQKKQVYVSVVSGDDKNGGTKDAPYKTIEKALNAMKNQNGGVIWVEGGNYPLTKTIAINDSHSGTVISPLFIKSYGDKDVTLTSNVIVDSAGFKLVDPSTDAVASRLKNKVKDKVYYLNLYELGWKESDIADITQENGPARVYVDGEEFTLARYPNAYYEDGVTPIDIKDLLYFKYVYEIGSVTEFTSDLYLPWLERVEADPNLTLDSQIGWEIRIPHIRDPRNDRAAAAMGDEITSWVNTGDIWYYGSIFEGFALDYFKIDSSCVHGDGLLGTLKDDGFYSLKSVHPDPRGCKDSGNSAAGRNTYYLFNAIEALDVPGEWFIDKKTGNFYIYPKSDDITKQTVAYSGNNNFNLVSLTTAGNVVFDGIGADGSGANAINLKNCDNIMIQCANFRNTRGSAVNFEASKNSALIYSNLSHAYSSMVRATNAPSTLSLNPDNIFIQNNTFSDTPPAISHAVMIGGCRVVVSHNRFIDCCMGGSGMEHIVEYNEFEGGNSYITDGGMVYFGGYESRGLHVRNNLFHMFKKTHNAVYFDTMGSGMYAYYNVINTLGGQASRHTAWYSSSGHGNVCYSNIIVLRNKAQADATQGVDTDEGTGAIKMGDDINESAHFYHYYGDNDARNSLAGDWWTTIKGEEISRARSYNQDAWSARYPEYMNFLQGTKLVLEAYVDVNYKIHYAPQALSPKIHPFVTADDTVIWVPAYEYLDENGVKQTKEAHTLTPTDGKIMVSYDDIVSIERLRRQPAFNVIKNNLILGGSTELENVITSSTQTNKTMMIKGLTLKEDNYFEFDYKKIIEGADDYSYEISDEVWSNIASEMGTEFVSILKTIDYQKAGLTD